MNSDGNPFADQDGAGKALLANVNPGMVARDFMMSVLAVCQHSEYQRQVGGFLSHPAGPCLSIFRNEVVAHFLEDTTLDWLWFVDSDISFPVDALSKLLDTADPISRPIVGGVYVLPMSSGVIPAAFRHGHNERGVKTMIPLAWDEVPSNSVIEVDSTGAGFLLIHRSVLETMLDHYSKAEPWFAQDTWTEDTAHPTVMGEDHTFCVRARRLGFSIHLDTSIDLQHRKSSPIHTSTFLKEGVLT